MEFILILIRTAHKIMVVRKKSFEIWFKNSSKLHELQNTLNMFYSF